MPLIAIELLAGMELNGEVGKNNRSLVEEELSTSTAETPVESQQADECADVGNSIVEAPLQEKKPLAGLDMLRFKDSFFEVVEELRFRRSQDLENLRRIQELLSEKHKLMQKMDEMEKRYQSYVEESKIQQIENIKKHEEEVRQFNSDQVKANILKDSREKELKSLKDEMRVLHLTNHNHEKRVQELERQLQLQNSSRDNHLNKMAQLEEKCSLLMSLAEQVKEQIARLEANVRQAEELQKKLEYVNSHQKCELAQVQRELKSCNQELVQLRAKSHDDKILKTDSGSAAKLKSIEQELILQSELCKHLQEEITSLRLEHQRVLQQLQEAHNLLDRQVENSKKSQEKEEVLKLEVERLKEDIENLRGDLFRTREKLKNQDEEHLEIKENLEKEFADTKQRLSVLQIDFRALQDSYESLESSKKSLLTEHEFKFQTMVSHNEELERKQIELVTEVKELKEKSTIAQKHFELWQSALEQSEAAVVELKSSVEERDEEISKLKERTKTHCEESDAIMLRNSSTHSSPEVISDTDAPVQLDRLSNKVLQNPSQSLGGSMKFYQDSQLCDSTDNPSLPPPQKKPKLESASPQSCTYTHSRRSELDAGLPSTLHQGNNNNNNKDTKLSVIEIQDSPPVISSEKDKKSESVGTRYSDSGKQELEVDGCKIKLDSTADNKHKEMMAGVETKNVIEDESSPSSPGVNTSEKKENLFFSPEELSSHNILMNTQINRQIEKVEKFLRTDRLRRTKDTVKFIME